MGVKWARVAMVIEYVSQALGRDGGSLDRVH